jgi:tetratricopeptide (TPR) repeat protein
MNSFLSLQVRRFRTLSRTWILLSVLTLCLFSIACKTKHVTVSAPKISSEVAQHVAEGDTYLQNASLYGWRLAEAAYQKAYNLSGSEKIKKKLLLIRFLILIRQIDEDIPYHKTAEVIKELCTGDEDQQTLCAIAEWFKNGKNGGQLKLNNPIFRGDDPAIESYLNLLLFQAIPHIDLFQELQICGSKSIESPLFLYLNPTKLSSIDPDEFEKNYPQYAEGFEFIGEALFQNKKYRTARTFFQKAIDLIPNYTISMIGIGNIYSYGLEDFEKALHYYEQALDRDSSNVAAMFGKGMALQQMGKYQESNATLDLMLAGNLTRKKWIDGIPYAQYYKGEALYLKAYNHYLMHSNDKARELIDSAKKILSDSQEINYLSGLLSYQSNDLESAREDFLRAVGDLNYTSCNAQFHLGLIYQQLGAASGSQPIPTKEEESSGKKTVQYLTGAGACMESAVKSLKFQIDSLSLIDLDPNELLILKGKLEKNLLDMRISSSSTIEMIISQISMSEIAEKEVYLKYLNEILSRHRAK